MYEDSYLDSSWEDRYDCLGDEPEGGYDEGEPDDDFDDDYDEEPWENDHDGADAYALASAGFGTDEDYGGGEDRYIDF